MLAALTQCDHCQWLLANIQWKFNANSQVGVGNFPVNWRIKLYFVYLVSLKIDGHTQLYKLFHSPAIQVNFVCMLHHNANGQIWSYFNEDTEILFKKVREKENHIEMKVSRIEAL